MDLQLDQNELSGEIPPELGNLSGLNRLEIWENRLTGPIPPELGNLTNLTYLSMGGNELTGCVPSALENAYIDIDYPICEAGDPTPPAPPPPTPPVPPVAPTPPLPPAPPAATPTPTPPAATPTPPPTATPAPTPTPRPLPDICGDAVSDRSNTGLVTDCNALLAAKDTLRGTAGLNWAPSTDIAGWDGITLGGSPRRVTKVILQKAGTERADTGGAGQTGDAGGVVAVYQRADRRHSSRDLGDLSNLTWLFVSNNNLSGQIPENVEQPDAGQAVATPEQLHRLRAVQPHADEGVQGGQRASPACAPPSGE